eukprot:122071-Prymnesium_polylepis.1
MQTVWRTLMTDPDITYAGIEEVAGGKVTSKASEAKYFVNDRIHMNELGYCAAFTGSNLQTAFGCQASTY